MRSHLKVLFTFIFISSVVIFAWFREGQLYGGGDAGLQTYNPQRMLENARFVWWEAAGPGAALPQGLSAIPFQFSLYLLQIIGFSPVAMQAILFFLLFVLMGFGMYLFVSTLFPEHKKYPLIAGIFYMFNPYMMIQVWHRFIHTTIILAAALPFLAMFWNNWIREGKVKYLLFFLLTSFLSVYAFGTYAFILAVWIFLSLFTFAAIIPWQGRKQVYRVGLRFIFGFIVWILINTWWMIPVSQISPAVLSAQHKTEESLMTLITISAQEALPYSLQLINPFYLIYQAELGTVYKNFLFQLLPWVFVFIIMFGLVNSVKHKTFSLFGIFYLLALFLAKGAASPFGNLFIFGFSNIFALGVLRNPFEKTGLILVFFSTILFTLGLRILVDRLKNPAFGKLLIIFVVLMISIFAWPMFLGKVIGRPDQPAYVAVPKSYQEADSWLGEQKKAGMTDGKILHLPLTSKESIQYKWKFGYNGLEPSDTFFTAYPSISRGFNIQRIDDALSGLAAAFQNQLINREEILDYLQDFNVRFIVLHKDVNWIGERLGNPQEIQKMLDSLEFLNRKQQFGDLVIYQVADQYFKPKVTFEHDINLLYPGEERISFWPALIKDTRTKYVSLIDTKKSDAFNTSGLNQTIIFPKASFLYGTASDSAGENIDFYLQRIRNLQPILKQTGMIQSLDLADKILALSAALQTNSDDYGKILRQIFPRRIEVNKFPVNGQEPLLAGIFRTHLAALRILNQSPVQELERNLIAFNLKPEFFDEDLIERQVFKFDVPFAAGFELLMLDSPSAVLYPDNLRQIKFYINDQQILLNSKVSGNSLSFGDLDLKSDRLEISYPLIFSRNLALAAVQYEGQSFLEIPIETVEAGVLYRISADVKVEGGPGFYILFYENSEDYINNNQTPQPSLKEFLQTNPLMGWQKFQLNIQTGPATKSAKIVIVPADNLRPQILLQDIKVQRVLRNQILLRNSTKELVSAEYPDESVEFTAVSAVSYKGKVKILEPGFLFFKETFHPGWKLTLNNKDGNYSPKEHVLGNLYANAWYIDKAGEYEFKIDFEPQNTFFTGTLLTIIGFGAIGGYLLWVKR